MVRPGDESERRQGRRCRRAKYWRSSLTHCLEVSKQFRILLGGNQYSPENLGLESSRPRCRGVVSRTPRINSGEIGTSQLFSFRRYKSWLTC
jgi:hypothetical protein